MINFGLRNEEYLDDVIDAWSDFENDLNGRWYELEHFGDAAGTILDMAAGVGSFVFRGLNRGHDVYGIEPEAWKLKYIKMRIDEEDKYAGYSDRIKYSLGESWIFKMIRLTLSLRIRRLSIFRMSMPVLMSLFV